MRMKNDYISMRKIKMDLNLRKNEAREYENRIYSPSAVVFDIQVHGYPLFVMLTPALLSTVVSIYKKSGQLSRLQAELPDIAVSWYMKRLLVDEIKLTNKQAIGKAVDLILDHMTMGIVLHQTVDFPAE